MFFSSCGHAWPVGWQTFKNGLIMRSGNRMKTWEVRKFIAVGGM